MQESLCYCDFYLINLTVLGLLLLFVADTSATQRFYATRKYEFLMFSSGRVFNYTIPINLLFGTIISQSCILQKIQYLFIQGVSLGNGTKLTVNRRFYITYHIFHISCILYNRHLTIIFYSRVISNVSFLICGAHILHPLLK